MSDHLDAETTFLGNHFRDIYQDKASTLPEQDHNKLHEEFNWLRPLYVRPYWCRILVV